MTTTVLPQLRITEIFFSLQGETRTVGLPTVFIRLTGCPLRCVYCDTAYAFKGGEMKSLEEIKQTVASFGAKYITVTGGEPLAQPNCLLLLTQLCDQGYIVSLETSGALDVAKVDPRVVKIIDLKTPGSKEMSRNLYSNLDYLTAQDQVKFVICNREDFEWSRDTMFHYQLPEKIEVLFSPSFTDLPPRQLAEWILAERLPVRMQLQAHKYIWGDVPGH